MMNVSRTRRHTHRLLLAAFLLVLSSSSFADVVLLPGVLAGQVGLEGWSFLNSSVALDGNASGYSAGISFPGSSTSFTLTAEGDQTYGQLTLTHLLNGGARFTLKSSTPYHIPAHDRLEVDLRRPVGTLVSRIQLTGGTLNRSWHTAKASNSLLNEQYEVDQHSSTGEVQFPMVAGEAISVEGTAVVSVTGAGGAVLCTLSMSLPSRSVPLERGATVTVTHALDVSAENCRGAVLSGTIALEGLPDGLEFSRATVRIPNVAERELEVSPLAPEYRFSGLPAGRYSLEAWLYFEPLPGTEGPSGKVLLPPDPFAIDVGEDADVVRDLRYPGVLVEGAFATKGYAATKLQSQHVYFLRHTKALDGSEVLNQSASFDFRDPLSRRFQALLTPGKWRIPDAVFHYSDPMQFIRLNYHYRPEDSLLVPESGTLRIPDVSLTNSNAFIVFDVDEGDKSAPEKNISKPSIFALRFHPVDRDVAFVESTRLVNDKPKPSVMLLGPRGTYTVSAYATIDGSRVMFSTSSVELGTSLLTEVGREVTVRLEDGAGAPLPMTLRFENVAQAGSSWASLTDMGPEPAEGYALLDFVSGTRFMSLGTTATFDEEVTLTATYDPTALGLTPAQESKLELHQFVCEEGQDERCAWVRISPLALKSSGFGCGSVAAANPDLLRHEITGRTSTLGLLALAIPEEDAQPQPPQVACVGSPEAPVRVELAPGTCGLLVDAAGGLAGSCTAGGAALDSCTFGGTDTLVLGPGVHPVTVTASASDGQSASCTSYVAVADVEPPQVSRVSATPSVLWPPNHAMHSISLQVDAVDACDPHPGISCQVTSSEPEEGSGDGHTPGDIEWREGNLWLRAERSGLGNGRVYTLTCTVRDASGNEASRVTRVTVPKSMGGSEP